MFPKFFILIITLALINESFQNQQLVIQHSNLINKIEPVMSIEDDKGNRELLTLTKIDRRGDIILQSGQSLVLSCPGGKNCLAINESQQLKTIESNTNCPNQKVFKFGLFTTSMVKNAKCYWPRLSSIIPEKKKRKGENGQRFNIGFHIPTFRQICTISYDKDAQAANYAIHSLEGHILLNQSSENIEKRVPYLQGMQETNVNVDSSYSLTNQGRVFKQLFQDQFAQYFNQKAQKYLIRGQLVPMENFYFYSWKIATYYEQNTAPMWYSIRQGNWKQVQESTRKLAIKSKSTLKIITITDGILKLPNEEKLEPMYLQIEPLKAIPVPERWVNVLYEESTGLGIGLVTSNNPYRKEISDNPFCPNICDENGWKNENGSSLFSDDLEKGITICCELNCLKTHFSMLKDLKVAGILKFNRTPLLGRIVTISQS